jgi:hypothetical protein
VTRLETINRLVSVLQAVEGTSLERYARPTTEVGRMIRGLLNDLNADLTSEPPDRRMRVVCIPENARAMLVVHGAEIGQVEAIQ